MRSRDPIRLRHDERAPDLLRLALDTQADEPCAADLAGLATGLGISPGPPTGAPPGAPAGGGSSLAAAGKSGALALAKAKLLSGVIVPALVGAMGATAALKATEPSHPTYEPSATGAAPAAVVSSTVAPRSSLPLPLADSPAPSSSRWPSVPLDAPRVTSGATERRQPAPSATIEPLEEPPSAPQLPSESEVALLVRAKASLDTDPEGALALADQHATRFPRGMLEQEAEVIAVEALARAGHSEQAVERLAKFRARFGNSAYLPHIESVVRHAK